MSVSTGDARCDIARMRYSRADPGTSFVSGGIRVIEVTWRPPLRFGFTFTFFPVVSLTAIERNRCARNLTSAWVGARCCPFRT